MNKTIKELFQKAGGIVEVCDVTQDEVLTYTHEMDVEKFADMIVRQCIFEMVHESTFHNDAELHNFIVGVKNRIMKRFGLK